MKKIYSLSCVLLLSSIATFAQLSEKGQGFQGTLGKEKKINNMSSVSELRSGPYDTTGVVNWVDFLPEFSSISGSYMWWWFGNATNHAGYCFGNNGNGWNIWAQGYENVNLKPVKIVGIIAGFRQKEHDNPSAPASSAVNFYLYNMANNSAYNTTGSGTYNNTVLNWPGPSGAPVASASLLFSAIDTAVDLTRVFPYRVNYVPFTTQPTFTGNFAIAMDARGSTTVANGYLPVGPLAEGDTVALITDMLGDAGNLDYAYTLQGYGGTNFSWIVADQWNSTAGAPDYGSGAMDVNIALFAVFSDATGVEDYFNGMKLTTYPNPAVERVTIEYTLEKNSNNVRLTVFDTKGSVINDEQYGSQSAGTYKVNLETTTLPAGTYLYQLRANGRNFTKQFVVAE